MSKNLEPSECFPPGKVNANEDTVPYTVTNHKLEKKLLLLLSTRNSLEYKECRIYQGKMVQSEEIKFLTAPT